MHLGDIIKNYRTENNLSMDYVAQKSGLSKGYISMLEKNKNPRTGNPIVPSLETIKCISDVVGIELDCIIKMLGDQDISLEKGKPDLAAYGITIDDLNLIEDYHKLDMEDKIEARSNIKYLLKNDKYESSKLETLGTKLQTSLPVAARNGQNEVKHYTEEQAKEQLEFLKKYHPELLPDEEK